MSSLYDLEHRSSWPGSLAHTTTGLGSDGQAQAKTRTGVEVCKRDGNVTEGDEDWPDLVIEHAYGDDG